MPLLPWGVWHTVPCEEQGSEQLAGTSFLPPKMLPFLGEGRGLKTMARGWDFYPGKA